LEASKFFLNPWAFHYGIPKESLLNFVYRIKMSSDLIPHGSQEIELGQRSYLLNSPAKRADEEKPKKKNLLSRLFSKL